LRLSLLGWDSSPISIEQEARGLKTNMARERLEETSAANPPRRRQIPQLAGAGGAAALAAACSAPVRGAAVPLDKTTQATVLGVRNERFFPLYGIQPLEAEFLAAGDRLRTTRRLAPGAVLPESSSWPFRVAGKTARSEPGSSTAGQSMGTGRSSSW